MPLMGDGWRLPEAQAWWGDLHHRNEDDMSDALTASQTDALARLTRYVQAQRLTQTLVDDFFDRLEQYLDDRADVDDGVPNEEAKLLAELRWVRR